MKTMRMSLGWNCLCAAMLGLIATAGAGHAASSVVVWGNNDYGQTNIPSDLNNVVAIAAGYHHSLALAAEGRVVGWGRNDSGETAIPSGLSNVVAIAAGGYHSLALTAEGRVIGWGDRSSGQTNIPSGLSNVVAIAAGFSHSLALTAEGRVVGWGLSDFGQTNIPSGLSNVVAIAAGSRHSLALTKKGRVVGWGLSGYGQTNIPSGLSNVVAIGAGYYHNLALTAEGRVVGWGGEGQSQTSIPTGLSNVVAIAAGGWHSLALTAGGRVVGWWANVFDYRPMDIPTDLNNVVAIAAGGLHSLAVTGTGSPAITVQPASQLVNAGGSATFAVWATGMPPMRYQWRKGDSDLPGDINAWLRLVSVTPSHGGDYTVTVSNFTGGVTTSLVATLTVQCLLTVTATTGGSVVRCPELPAYPGDSLVTLTPTPAAGYSFIRWSGDATGSTNPLTVAMNTNKNITAVFASTALTLPSQGVGAVAKVPDQPFYSLGELVALTATAGRWHVFTGWTDGVTSNPRLVTIGESNAYTAVFTPTTPLETMSTGGVSRLAPIGMPAVVVDNTFILTESVGARGSAQVTLTTRFPGGSLFYTLDGSDPAGSAMLYSGPFRVGNTSLLRTLAYNADFAQSVAGDPVSIVILPTLTGLTDGGGSVAIEPPAGDYFSNALALVTATPAPGWTFLQWLGDASGTNPVVNLTMTRNKTARAVFGTPLTTTVVGGGSIVVRPVSSRHPYGSQVRLTAVPATGNYLAFWANAAVGRTNNPLLFVVTNANPTVTAVFSSLGGSQTNALTVIPSGRGQVTLTPPGNRFRLNTNVVLQAIAEPGQDFIGWLGDASGSQNPLVVTMNSNKVIAAAFTQRPRLQGEGHPELLSQDGFRLTVTGEFGGFYEILGAADWSGWTPLGTVTNTWGLGQFTDPGAITNAQRWYRARAVE